MALKRKEHWKQAKQEKSWSQRRKRFRDRSISQISTQIWCWCNHRVLKTFHWENWDAPINWLTLSVAAKWWQPFGLANLVHILASRTLAPIPTDAVQPVASSISARIFSANWVGDSSSNNWTKQLCYWQRFSGGTFRAPIKLINSTKIILIIRCILYFLFIGRELG